MADFVIFENPGNKAARLERENASLRAENRRLREALGEAHVMVEATATAAPAIATGQNSFTHGACAVTIGARPGGPRPSAIPGLAQQAPATHEGDPLFEAHEGATKVQIFNAGAAAPAAPRRATPPPRRIGHVPGGGGMAELSLAQLRPIPVKPPAPAQTSNDDSVTAESIDDAKQRFALLELDVADEQQTGTGK